MKRLFIYFIMFLGLLGSCEEIYNPEIEKVENVIVADARLIAGSYNNEIILYKSLGYNEKEKTYPEISGATVSITDSEGNEFNLFESTSGHYPVQFWLNPRLNYKLKIEHGGNIYESSFEPVPSPPSIDTIFGVKEKKVIAADGENNIDNFKEVEGLQLYCNILNGKELPYYRFSANRVMQYTYLVEVPFFGGVLQRVMYGWNTREISGSFNVAAPNDYGNSSIIIKHPLFFMPKSPDLNTGYSFNGWILIMRQYRISQSEYAYYSDLNKQLEANGNLFDPMYVQARNNLKCINNPEQIILGNFEIASANEYRYFVHYLSDEKGYMIKPIPWFYEIPPDGEILEYQPEFWEVPDKKYP